MFKNSDGTYSNIDEDGIDEIYANQKSDPQNDAIYDISGRKILNGKLHHGLYIVNGKKVLY